MTAILFYKAKIWRGFGLSHYNSIHTILFQKLLKTTRGNPFAGISQKLETVNVMWITNYTTLKICSEFLSHAYISWFCSPHCLYHLQVNTICIFKFDDVIYSNSMTCIMVYSPNMFDDSVPSQAGCIRFLHIKHDPNRETLQQRQGFVVIIKTRK